MVFQSDLNSSFYGGIGKYWCIFTENMIYFYEGKPNGIRECKIRQVAVSSDRTEKSRINYPFWINSEESSPVKYSNIWRYSKSGDYPYTAFDLAVKKQHANDEMMYICIRRELARRNNFKVLPKHPLSLEDCQLYDYEEGFKRIDWDTMAKVGLTDPDSKQTKMAECLSAKVIPVDCFQCFYVPSEQSKEFAENTLRAYGIKFPPPFVNVMPQWFWQGGDCVD